MDEAAEFQDAIQSLDDALRAGVKAFAKWYAREWQTNREQWLREYADPPPEGDWFDGFNAGVEAVEGAAKMFLDEWK
jgi:hypothetical protein